MVKFPIIKMAGIVIRSLLGGSACRMYPSRKVEFYPATRGCLEIETEKCILCTLCAKKCPAEALEVVRDGGTWEVDRLKCVVCGICVENCPQGALSLRADYTPPVSGEKKDIFRINHEESRVINGRTRLQRPAGSGGQEDAQETQK